MQTVGVSDLERAIAALALDHPDVLSVLDAVTILSTARDSGLPLIGVLMDKVPEGKLLSAIAAELDLPYVDLFAVNSAYRVEEDLIKRCDISMLKTHNALPLRGPNEQVCVAMANPRAARDMVDYVRTALPEPVTIVLGSMKQIQNKLVYFDVGSYDASSADNQAAYVADSSASPLPTSVSDSPVVAWVDNLLARAAAEGASDVHFQFQADGTLLVRFRVDGVLRRQPVQMRHREKEIVGTLLSKCETIDASDRTRAQDGTFSFSAIGGRTIDARLGMLPQAHGPTVVCRLLDPANINRKLDDMGFAPSTLEQMRRVLRAPQGALFMIGPTGSGKAVTLTTTIPTPTGTTTMGDLRVGDQVLGSDGLPCQVTGLSDIIERPELYRVRFSDGQEVLADRDHQWLVSSHHGRNVPRTRKRQAAVERHRGAHTDAAALTELAGTFGPGQHLTAGEIFAALTEHRLTGEIGSVNGVAQALAVTECPRRSGHRAGARQRYAVVEYPAAAAFTLLAVRLAERFHTPPSETASLSRMTTGELLAAGLRLPTGHTNFAVPVAGALQLPDADLPLDPYLFGCWLGDGATDTGRISVGDEDLDFFLRTLGEARPIIAARDSHGVNYLQFGRPEADLCVRGHDEQDWREAVNQRYCVSCRGAGVDDPRVNVSLHVQLRALGVLGRKHIPVQYLRSSHTQRLALLQGLMDTDGTISRAGGCELSLSDKTLATDALNLIRSLGIKATVSWDAKSGYRSTSGEPIEGKARHRIRFRTSQQVFALPRKANRLPLADAETRGWLYITSIDTVAADDPDYGPARCISVDSTDHTYLCGPGYVVTSNTTTLYGLLKELPAMDLNILTAEDPIEYRLPFIGQTQIRGDLGEKSLTFAKVLRSFLRLDPDVILVGEVRDSETAETAMHAALTGHLVLSTLHAKSAFGVFSRLEELGVDPFLTSETLSLAVNQRLIRRVHECCTVEPPNAAEIAFLTRHGLPVPALVPRAAKTGCAGCNGSGYRGRIAVVEVLEPSTKVRTMVTERAPMADVILAAQGEGYTSILTDAFRHVMEGRTTVQELLRCIDTGGM